MPEKMKRVKKFFITKCLNIFLIIIFTFSAVGSDNNGRNKRQSVPLPPNVCSRVERYTRIVNVTKLQPQYQKNNKPCRDWQQDCPKFKTVYVTVSYPQTVEWSREIRHCCDGYEEKLNRAQRQAEINFDENRLNQFKKRIKKGGNIQTTSLVNTYQIRLPKGGLKSDTFNHYESSISVAPSLPTPKKRVATPYSSSEDLNLKKGKGGARNPICIPKCALGCIQGECVSPGYCKCFRGFAGNICNTTRNFDSGIESNEISHPRRHEELNPKQKLNTDVTSKEQDIFSSSEHKNKSKTKSSAPNPNKNNDKAQKQNENGIKEQDKKDFKTMENVTFGELMKSTKAKETKSENINQTPTQNRKTNTMTEKLPPPNQKYDPAYNPNNQTDFSVVFEIPEPNYIPDELNDTKITYKEEGGIILFTDDDDINLYIRIGAGVILFIILSTIIIVTCRICRKRRKIKENIKMENIERKNDFASSVRINNQLLSPVEVEQPDNISFRPKSSLRSNQGTRSGNITPSTDLDKRRSFYRTFDQIDDLTIPDLEISPACSEPESAGKTLPNFSPSVSTVWYDPAVRESLNSDAVLEDTGISIVQINHSNSNPSTPTTPSMNSPSLEARYGRKYFPRFNEQIECRYSPSHLTHLEDPFKVYQKQKEIREKSQNGCGEYGEYDWVPPPVRVSDSYHIPALLDVSFLFSQYEGNRSTPASPCDPSPAFRYASLPRGEGPPPLPPKRNQRNSYL